MPLMCVILLTVQDTARPFRGRMIVPATASHGNRPCNFNSRSQTSPQHKVQIQKNRFESLSVEERYKPITSSSSRRGGSRCSRSFGVLPLDPRLDIAVEGFEVRLGRPAHGPRLALGEGEQAGELLALHQRRVARRDGGRRERERVVAPEYNGQVAAPLEELRVVVLRRQHERGKHREILNGDQPRLWAKMSCRGGRP